MVRVLNTLCVALMGLAILGLYHVSESTRVAAVELHHVQRDLMNERTSMSVLETELGTRSPVRRRSRSWPPRNLGLTGTPAVQPRRSTRCRAPRRGRAERHADPQRKRRGARTVHDPPRTVRPA